MKIITCIINIFTLSYAQRRGDEGNIETTKQFFVSFISLLIFDTSSAIAAVELSENMLIFKDFFYLGSCPVNCLNCELQFFLI